MPDFMALIVIFALVTLCTKLVGGVTSFKNGGFILPIMLITFCGLAYAHPFDWVSNKAHWDHERLGMVLFISLLAVILGSLWRFALDQHQADLVRRAIARLTQAPPSRGYETRPAYATRDRRRGISV